MKNIYYILILFFFTPLFTQAQVNRCGTDQLHEEKMKDPVFAKKFREIDRLIRQQSKLRSPSCATPIILPVAVHWNGNITNANMTCLETIIDNQIDILNEDFGGYNTDIVNYCNHSANCPTEYPPNSLGGGTCVQFCIATENHPASANLVDGDYAMTFGQYEFPPLSQTTPEAPDWAGYVNFFVSDVDPAGYTNLLGLAPLSGGDNPDGNGIFVTSASFGGDNYSCTSGVLINGSANYGLGRTATHEAGHYFGLPHVFNTSVQGASPDCSFDEDNIGDTPLQAIANFGVKTIDYGTCVSTANNTCGTQDFFFDFMDYGNDEVLYMFTSDQADIINTVATAGTNSANPYQVAATTCATLPSGYSPTYPTGCPVATPPESAFSINGSAPYEFCPAMNEVSFTDMSTNFASSWAWTFSGAGVSPTSSTDQNPTVNVNSSGTLTVTLTASNNGGGADPTPASMTYTITILPAASCGNCGESFFDTGGSGGNYGNNEDMTWTLCAADPSEVVAVDFTSIDIDVTAFQDRILVTHGTTAATSNSTADYIVMLQSVYVDEGGGSYGSVSDKIVSCESCMTFRFISDGSGTNEGWEADVTCIAPETCSDGSQNQNEEYVDCGGNEYCETCSTCPTPCEGFTFYDAGGPSNETGPDQQLWTMCADDVSEKVTVDFTTIDMQPFNSGILTVYEGTTTSGDWEYYISGTAIYIDNGAGGLIPHGSTSITSLGQCYTFQFFTVNNMSSNGWVAEVSSDCALPISLVSFVGEQQDGNILLKWKSETEINADKYVIQRSERNGDFIDIGSIDACGNCSFTNEYQFLDIELKTGNEYQYRLEMIDMDGYTAYSDKIHFDFKLSEDWNIYPNPNRGVFTLELNNKNQYNRISVIDKLGREVYNQTLVDENENQHNIDLGSLQAGYYQLLLEGTTTTAKPIIVLPK